MESIPVKQCSSCGEMKSASSEFFYKGNAKYGFMSECISCRKNRVRCTWRAKTPEERREIALEKSHKYRASHIAAAARYRERNLEKVRAGHRAYYHAHKEQFRAAKSRRRARAYGADGAYSVADWTQKLARYKGRCHYCGKVIKGQIHREHVIPLSRGGMNIIGNIVPSCAPCNLKKGRRLPHEWIGRLL